MVVALSVGAVGTPGYGVAAINGDGTISYTPALNYSGYDSFTYTIQDSFGRQAMATVNVTVTPVNDGPTAADDVATTAQDSGGQHRGPRKRRRSGRR